MEQPAVAQLTELADSWELILPHDFTDDVWRITGIPHILPAQSCFDGSTVTPGTLIEKFPAIHLCVIKLVRHAEHTKCYMIDFGTGVLLTKLQLL